MGGKEITMSNKWLRLTALFVSALALVTATGVVYMKLAPRQRGTINRCVKE